jgi:hypothetical protein
MYDGLKNDWSLWNIQNKITTCCVVVSSNDDSKNRTANDEPLSFAKNDCKNNFKLKAAIQWLFTLYQLVIPTIM